MGRENCSYCQRIFGEIKRSHPDWPVRDRFQLAEKTLLNVREDGECRLKRCFPLEQAQRTLKVLSEPRPVPSQEYLVKAAEVVENHILDEVHGHPDKFTAYASARICGCGNCRRNLEAWERIYERRGE